MTLGEQEEDMSSESEELDSALVDVEALEVERVAGIGARLATVAGSFPVSVTSTGSFPFTSAATITVSITTTFPVTFPTTIT
jgi:hypothetical protein